MRHALYVPNFGAFGSARALAELAERAEAAGWDGVFIWDHLARAWPTEVVDPWIALAAMAVRTRTLVLGALVTPLARRRPWKLARETVSLDHLSGGRLVFGAGLGSAGGSEAEWHAFGEESDLRVRAAMLDEGLELLAGLWSARPFSFRGEHYRVNDVLFRPGPLQSPRIPIWIGGYWPAHRPFRRAARWDGMIPLFDPRRGPLLDQLREAIAFVRSERSATTAFDVAHVHATEPGAAPVDPAPFAAAGVTWWLERLGPQQFGADWQDPWPVEQMHARVSSGPLRG